MEALTLWFLHFFGRDSKDRLLYLMGLELFWVYFKRSFPEEDFCMNLSPYNRKSTLLFKLEICEDVDEPKR